ncbi:unnamed protein product [Adineta ricciae]|uniref:RING-type E3 ubiquitin transferase n=1 Tax=Adineta ricciae TaxID=249248 RepID=A0A815MFS1_ADIRI|nr:unnamed protein product [Adineta ricciae]CAF1421952.1 unnamed protein product [Adineta ricciae]
MASLPSRSMATRKRTRSTNVTENNVDHQHTTTTTAIGTGTLVAVSNTISAIGSSSVAMPPLPATANALNAPPKRHRNNPPPRRLPPPVAPRASYSLRNRSLTPDPRHSLTRFPSVSTTSTTRQRYNLRTRRPASQIRLPQVPAAYPAVAPRRFRQPIPPINPATHASAAPASSTYSPLISPPPPVLPPPIPVTIPISSSVIPLVPPPPPVVQPRQYRLVYISDEDDEQQPVTSPTTDTIVESVYNLLAADGDNLSTRTTLGLGRTSRATSGAGFNIRSRATTATPLSASSTSSSSSASTINNEDFITGVTHIRLSRAIEIVIDSIQSLEGTVNNFDQLVFGLIYGRLGTRNEFDSIENMIRLSRILSFTLPSPRLSREEIDSLPKISFVNERTTTTSIQLAEKCPICLTEFDDQEIINKLYCTHLFHLPCISTWLSENDSCPTCRRKVTED